MHNWAFLVCIYLQVSLLDSSKCAVTRILSKLCATPNLPLAVYFDIQCMYLHAGYHRRPKPAVLQYGCTVAQVAAQFRCTSAVQGLQGARTAARRFRPCMRTFPYDSKPLPSDHTARQAGDILHLHWHKTSTNRMTNWQAAIDKI